MAWFILILAALFLFLALVNFARSRRNKLAAGLGQVRVVYNDAGNWIKVPVPLFSEKYGLSGKPDYIVREPKGLAVVEVKPLRHSSRPYESDIMQLAAYCLLLEEDWLERPLYGLLRYANLTFRVEWTAELREKLLALLQEMREVLEFPAELGGEMPEPQHNMSLRCGSCGFQYICWPGLK